MTKSPPPVVIALDLEGTLISNAVSQIPRPHLHAFARFCCERFARIVLFTAVPGDRCHQILATLTDEGVLPRAFVERCEHVSWSGPYKDLRFVEGADPRAVLLVDDQEPCVHPEQRDRWIAVHEFAPPYPASDDGLERLMEILTTRLEDGDKR